jgi:sterol desaturase/sphingolipid hydroxylase (fatty acid hydroxylase superfamily)
LASCLCLTQCLGFETALLVFFRVMLPVRRSHLLPSITYVIYLIWMVLSMVMCHSGYWSKECLGDGLVACQSHHRNCNRVV